MSETGTLFVQYSGQWTQEQVDELTDAIDGVTGENVDVIVTPDEINYATTEEVQGFVDCLADALEDDD